MIRLAFCLATPTTSPVAMSCKQTQECKNNNTQAVARNQGGVKSVRVGGGAHQSARRPTPLMSTPLPQEEPAEAIGSISCSV